MTNKKFYWFGASWVFGDELHLFDVSPESKDSYTFAGLVSQHFEADCVNLSLRGSSINYMPMEFYKILNDINVAQDTMFFLLPSNHRTSLFDEQGDLKNILGETRYQAHNVHPYADKWYKFFDNPAQRSYNFDCVLNLLYFWCQDLGVRCYFANVDSIIKKSTIDSTPASVWLLPKEQCLAQFILPIIDQEYDTIITDDNPRLTDAQWAMQKTAVEKYIRPCWTHPNLEGHKKIAQTIIKILKNE